MEKIWYNMNYHKYMLKNNRALLCNLSFRKLDDVIGG